MEGWEKRGGGEEVGESHSPSTLGALSWNQSLSGWEVVWKGPGQGSVSGM